MAKIQVDIVTLIKNNNTNSNVDTQSCFIYIYIYVMTYVRMESSLLRPLPLIGLLGLVVVGGLLELSVLSCAGKMT